MEKKFEYLVEERVELGVRLKKILGGVLSKLGDDGEGKVV